MDGAIENLEITPGMLLTVSDFTLQEDIELTTAHEDLCIFQLSFCLEGGMEWAYINGDTVHRFRISAQQSQVRYGTFQECRSKIPGNHRCQSVSITLDEKMFEQVFTCITARGALCDTRESSPARVYTYTPKVGKILSEIKDCSICDELRRVYLQGKILELIAIYCDEVICRSPSNDFGIRISTEDYAALLKAREIISQSFAHPHTISTLAKAVAINEQRLKDGFRRCFGLTVHDYIIEKRMEAAQKLLTAGKCSVRETAWMVGYSHTGHFIKLFQKYHGLSPGQMLRTNR
jgi:AraC-like DNA-binding protein